MNFTKQELAVFAAEQRKIFDLIRLVDTTMTLQYTIKEDGSLFEEPYKCYAFWRRDKRCENCVSSKAFAIKGKTSKFEFLENQIYFVIALYAIVEGKEYVIELISILSDETLFDAYGKSNFVKSVEAYNKKLYVDSLTGAYNRRYYVEQLKKLNTFNGAAMLDVDNMKHINDTYGHAMGDLILTEIGKAISAHLESPDAFIRLGGDEFLIVCYDIEKEKFKNRLEKILKDVSEISVPENPDVRVSISIGAVYADNPINKSIILQSDKSLYEAKKQKNKIVLIEV